MKSQHEPERCPLCEWCNTGLLNYGVPGEMSDDIIDEIIKARNAAFAVARGLSGGDGPATRAVIDGATTTALRLQVWGECANGELAFWTKVKELFEP